MEKQLDTQETVNLSEKTPWQLFKEKNGGVTPLDLINRNSPKSSEELAAARYTTCQGCERFLNVTKQCLECGCFMNLKTRLLNAKCPLGKW